MDFDSKNKIITMTPKKEQKGDYNLEIELIDEDLLKSKYNLKVSIMFKEETTKEESWAKEPAFIPNLFLKPKVSFDFLDKL